MFLWITGAAGLLAIRSLRDRKRKTALRALAVRRGLTFQGRVLPRSFTLSGTALDGATSIWNVMDRDCAGLRVIAFDCRIGSGRGRWRRTAIAVQGPHHVFGAPKFNTGLAVDGSGDWSILYEPEPRTLLPIPNGLMSVSGLEGPLRLTGC